MNSSLSTLIKRTDMLQAKERHNRADMTKRRSRLAELEYKNLRSNLRLVRLVEGEEGDDPTSFQQQKLLLKFPALSARDSMEIERAHHMYCGAQANRNNPCLLIFKLLCYRDCQAIMRAYRKTNSSVFQGQRILLIFVDYSIHTNLRRKAFAPVFASLKERGIEIFLIYPAKLKVLYNSKQHFFDSPEEVTCFVQQLSLVYAYKCCYSIFYFFTLPLRSGLA